jgi:hypothetical protein
MFTLWAFLTSFILGLRWQWWLFLPLSSSTLATTTSAMMTMVMVVLCGNSGGGEQVVMEVWICRWRNLFLFFSISCFIFKIFFFYLWKSKIVLFMHGFQVHVMFDLWKNGTHALLRALYATHFLYYWSKTITPFWIKNNMMSHVLIGWGKGVFHIIGHGICMYLAFYN